MECYPCHDQVHLRIGEGNVYAAPTVVRTVLGSCVSVTFYSPVNKIGAIFHALMPVMPAKEKNGQAGNHFKYVDTSIFNMIRRFQELGVKKSQLEAKVFGGSQAFFVGDIKPGPTNIRVAFEILAEQSIKVIASDVGGDKGRNLLFVSNTGEVFIKTHKNNLFEVMQGKRQLQGISPAKDLCVNLNQI